MNTIQSKSDFILDNAFIFLGLAVMICGICIGITYEFDEQVQNAELELRETSYGITIGIIERLIVLGYWTMFFGGIGLCVLGYSLKRLLK